MESIFKLGILLKIMDLASGPVQQISRSMDTLRAKAEKLQPVFDKFKEYGKWIVGAGVAGALALGITVTQFANLEEAQLRLRTTLMDSAGVVGPEYQKLNALAEKLGSDLPGSTKDMVQMFIALREQGVQTNRILGGTGEAAAKFAALMKLGFAESATHVAKFSESMGVADDDMVRFMDLLQRLKYASGVEVGDLAYTFKFAGGALKLLGLQGLEAAKDFSTIVGVLAAAGIEGSTAGTNMAQALSRMAEIGHRLDRGQIAKLVGPILDQYQIKLDFFTSAGEFKGLRPMIAELEKLKALNPQEQIITLKKLFGEEAARPLAVLLKSGVAGYDQMLERIRQQADMEMKIQEIMSGTKMQWETLSGTVSNLVAHIGGVVAKVSFLPGIMAKVNDLAGRFDAWVVANPKTAGIIGGVVIAVTTLTLAVGGILLAIGIGGTLVTKMALGFGLLVQAIALIKAAALAAIPALWGMTAALLSNPMTWVVIGIVAAVTALGAVMVWMYRRVEWFKTLMDGFLFFIGFSLGIIVKGWTNLARWIFYPFQLIWSIIDRVIGILPKISSSVSDALAGMLNAFPAIFSGLYESGRKIIATLVDGIMSAAEGPVDAVKSIFQRVRNLLPFSDAREGPLSRLTLSGQRMMQTLGMGISVAAPEFRKAVAAGLAGVALTTAVAVKPMPAQASMPAPPAVTRMVAPAESMARATAVNPGLAAPKIETPDITVSAPPSVSVPSGSREAAMPQARSTTGSSRKIVVHIERIELNSVTNAQDFVRQLQALVEGYDAY